MILWRWCVASDLLLYDCVVNCVLMMMMWIWVWFTTWQSDLASSFAWVVRPDRGMVMYLLLVLAVSRLPSGKTQQAW